MSEILCAAPLIRGTEFFLNDQRVRLFGTCGQRGLASVASSALGTDVNPLGIYDSMLNHGWCDVGGASTIGGLLNQAKVMNLPVAAFQGYGEPWNGWYAWCKAQVSAGNPTLVETANGQALIDAISAAGENAQNLQYHFFALLGYFSGGFSSRAQRTLPEGFWCADGDNFAGGNNNANNFNAANVLQFYSISRLSAARLCAALAIKGKAITMAWTKLSDGRGLDDKGHNCGSGFMTQLLAAGEASVDGLMSETYLPDKTSFLPLANGNVYTYDGAVHTNQGAEVSVKLYGLYEAALKQATSAPVVPASAPAPAPISQADQLAIEALAAIKAALAA